MIGATLKLAQDAMHDAAATVLLRVAATLLACSALLIAAGAAALGLSELMPAYLAVLTTAIILGVCASVLFLLAGYAERKSDYRTMHDPRRLGAFPAGTETSPDALKTLAGALITQQADRAPLATLAAALAASAALSRLNGDRPNGQASCD